MGWDHIEKNGVRLHHSTYYEIKATYPGLVSDLLIQARVKATEALKSAFTWKQKHETSFARKVVKALKQGKPEPVFKPIHCPQSRRCPVRYNEKTYTLNWQTQSIHLSTTRGKMSLWFTIPHFSARYAGKKVATADLILRKGKWWLHVVVDVPEPTSEKSDSTAIVIMCSPNASSRTPHQARLLYWKTSPTSAKRLRLDVANRTQMVRTSENCTVGLSRSSPPLPNTKRRNAGSKWSGLIPGTRRKAVRVVGIKPVIIAVLNPCSFAENVATASMQSTMPRKISETSISPLLPLSRVSCKPPRSTRGSLD